MRFTVAAALVLCTLVSYASAEPIAMQLEWGFGPVTSEMLWDGEVRISGGTLMKMEAFSFERDKRDRMTPPTFRSYTQNDFSDGMDLIVDGEDQTRVLLKCLQGDFAWSVGELREKKELSFTGKDGGRLVVRLVETLGENTIRLSDEKTQDSDPAICLLPDGRQVIVWRAFVGLPAPGEDLDDTNAGNLGDRICLRVLDRAGRPDDLLTILPDSNDVETIRIAAVAGGVCQLVWSEQREKNWDLYSCRLKMTDAGVECSSVERLTNEPGVDRKPALAATLDGSLVLAWQGWRDGRSTIFFRRCRSGTWEEPTALSDEKANDWYPTIATSKSGAVAVSWFRWQNDSYDVCLREWDAGQWGPVQTVASTARYEALPSVAYDRNGTLWIAYEEGREGWGLDSHTAGLRSVRNVRLGCYREGKLLAPAAAAALSLDTEFTDRSEMAHLVRDGKDVLWLFFRRLRGPGIWEIFGTSLSADGWAKPQKIGRTEGGQDVAMAAASDAEGRLRVVWSSDHRVQQFGLDNYVYTAKMPAREARAVDVETEPTVLAEAGATEPIPSRGDRATFVHGDKSLGLYFGDLHRHTEQSVCRTGSDSGLEDTYRYAIDAAGLDFLCISDHVQHVKILNDLDFWRNGKSADLNRVASVHQPFYGYERSQRFPYGHRNIISLDRYVRRVPRTADNRPTSANAGYEGEERIAPPDLWKRLLGENAITIPHTSTSPVMGTDFGHEPAPMEPVVEIYQGCRYTTEYENAPDPRQERDEGPYGGKTQPKGFMWYALGKGYRYGFIASSDHAATHNSYTCVWAEDFSNQAIHDALAKRQCYAATDKIQCRMAMAGHLMGSEFKAKEVPPLEVAVVGTTDIDRVDVIKDNMIVFTRSPNPPSPEVRFEFRDAQPDAGVHYYYARVIQKDRNMAWISPIWVDVEK